MIVIRAGILGFCMGVRRAVETACRESSKTSVDYETNRDNKTNRDNNTSCANKTNRVYTLGPLIHNPRVLENLINRGIRVLEPVAGVMNDLGSSQARGSYKEEVKDAAVIIRAHGISPAEERELVRLGARVIDATCPHVKVSQKKARSFVEMGYLVFLAGEKNHAEITGIRGYADDALKTRMGNQAHYSAEGGAANSGNYPSCYIVADPDEAGATAAKLASQNQGAKTALIGQTTISPGEYKAIGEKIKCYFPDLEIIYTICGKTKDRQKALVELSARVDAFVIAGSQDSANARRLLSIARDTGKKAWLVEDAAGIPQEVFAFSVVGLSAGASTPDETIDEIERALRGEP